MKTAAPSSNSQNQEIITLRQANPNSAAGNLNGFQLLMFMIGVGALLFFFSMVESIDDIREYGWELIIIFGMMSSTIYGFFKKKPPLTDANIFLKEEGIWLAGTGLISYKNLHLDLYSARGAFSRYHLWDTEGQLAIYSVYKDELATELASQKEAIVKEYTERSVKKAGDSIFCKYDEGATLVYELDSGAYILNKFSAESKKVTPKAFAIDPKYKRYHQ